MSELSAIPLLLLASALPLLVSWLVALVPSRQRYASDIRVGNPLLEAPLPIEQVVVEQPLVHLSRALTGDDVRGFIVGARHLPIEHTAPLMQRFIKGSDPALQLYGQSMLQEGVERLQKWQQQLDKAAAGDERCAAWLIEVGLILATRTLASAADRAAFLQRLVQVTEQCLAKSPKPCAHLLINATELFLEAEDPARARALLQQLPPQSPAHATLGPAIQHALNRQSTLV
jgi:hypothetical protein